MCVCKRPDNRNKQQKSSTRRQARKHVCYDVGRGHHRLFTIDQAVDCQAHVGLHRSFPIYGRDSHKGGSRRPASVKTNCSNIESTLAALKTDGRRHVTPTYLGTYVACPPPPKASQCSLKQTCREGGGHSRYTAFGPAATYIRHPLTTSSSLLWLPSPVRPSIHPSSLACDNRFTSWLFPPPNRGTYQM